VDYEGNDRKISDFGQEMTDEQRAAQKSAARKADAGPGSRPRIRVRDAARDTRQFVGPPICWVSGKMHRPCRPRTLSSSMNARLAYNSRFASNFAFSTERVSAEGKKYFTAAAAGVAPVWPEAISGNVPGPSPTPASGQPVRNAMQA